jgi:membrane-associated phospholipid phosphatase
MMTRSNTDQEPAPGSRKQTLARALSIAGHPFILIPAAALIVSGRGPALVLALTMLAVASVIFLQVRRGKWSDADVSTRQQRPLFYAVILAATAGAAFLLWRMGASSSFVRGTLIAIAMITIQMIANRWLKISLHASFAAFVTGIIATRGIAMAIAAACLALAIAWSRVTLKRHTLLEVVIGLGLGACAAIALWL